jgi:hypothetical protein
MKEILPKEIKKLELTPEEKTARDSDISVLCQMRNDRDKPFTELDGMTPVEYYDSNRKKDLSYLPPKKNEQDIRITTGLTREKDTTMLSTALNMNFVPDVKAFNVDDLLINELGDNLSDMNKKSREIEDWDRKRGLIYRELISQGDVFVQELYTDKFMPMPTSQVDFDPTSDKISDYTYTARLKKVFSGCEVRMVNAKKIYLGDMKIPYIEDQDRIAVLNVYNRSEAYIKYGEWERWESVPDTIDTMHFSDDGIYRSWNLTNIDKGQVGEVMVFDKARNSFQIYLNGIPMLPYNFMLTNVSPTGDVPFSQGKCEPISDFALSKGWPAKTKIDQEVLDEVTKLMVDGMRQGRKPPMGSLKKIIAKNIFTAGNITPDIKKGQLFPILEQYGLNNADFSFYQLIKQGIEDKTVSTAYEGTQGGGDPTATQVTQEKQQQMLKLGLVLDGIVNLERRMTWLRIFNIITNWTKKYDPDMGAVEEQLYGQYRTFSVDTTVEEGKKGQKIFRFDTKEAPSVREMFDEENALTKQYGKETRIVYMNPELLRMLKCKLFITINPTPQNNDLLTQILYIQNLRQAIELFGIESINMEYAKQRYAILINEDPNRFFNKTDIMTMLKQGMAEQQGGGDKTGMYGGMAGAVKKKPLKAMSA